MKHIINLKTIHHLISEAYRIELPQYRNSIPNLNILPLENNPEHIFLTLEWDYNRETYGVSVSEEDKTATFEDGILTLFPDSEEPINLRLLVIAQITPVMILQEEWDTTEAFLEAFQTKSAPNHLG